MFLLGHDSNVPQPKLSGLGPHSAMIALKGDVMTLHGYVQNGLIVLRNGASLPDGTLVQVTPLTNEAGNSLAVVAAMDSEPHLTAEVIAELRRAIASGKRPPIAFDT